MFTNAHKENSQTHPINTLEMSDDKITSSQCLLSLSMQRMVVAMMMLLCIVASPEGCEEECAAPRHCAAGRVKEGCCFVCGQREGERCDHPDIGGGGGRCGDQLECRVRSDLSWDDPPEAVCVCRRAGAVCGSDATTYDTMCQLTEARYSRRDAGLRAVSQGPCNKAPVISSPPQDVSNGTGRYAALTCEARAWPLATIRWERITNQQVLNLPGNQSRLAVQSRTGPNQDESTGWLLFLSLSPEDAGTYRCRAENTLGVATHSATLTLTPSE